MKAIDNKELIKALDELEKEKGKIQTKDDNRFSERQYIARAYLMKTMLEECGEDEEKQEK